MNKYSTTEHGASTAAHGNSTPTPNGHHKGRAWVFNDVAAKLSGDALATYIRLEIHAQGKGFCFVRRKMLATENRWQLPSGEPHETRVTRAVDELCACGLVERLGQWQAHPKTGRKLRCQTYQVHRLPLEAEPENPDDNGLFASLGNGNDHENGAFEPEDNGACSHPVRIPNRYHRETQQAAGSQKQTASLREFTTYRNSSSPNEASARVSVEENDEVESADGKGFCREAEGGEPGANAQPKDISGFSTETDAGEDTQRCQRIAELSTKKAKLGARLKNGERWLNNNQEHPERDKWFRAFQELLNEHTEIERELAKLHAEPLPLGEPEPAANWVENPEAAIACDICGDTTRRGLTRLETGELICLPCWLNPKRSGSRSRARVGASALQ